MEPNKNRKRKTVQRLFPQRERDLRQELLEIYDPGDELGRRDLRITVETYTGGQNESTEWWQAEEWAPLTTIDGWEGYLYDANAKRALFADNYEYVAPDGSRSGLFCLAANLFARQPVDAVKWMRTRSGREFSVCWGHSLQHTYAHMTDFNIKQIHTLWPLDATDQDLEDFLVEAVSRGEPGEVTQYPTLCGSMSIAWEEDIETHSPYVKTFYLSNPTDFPWLIYSPAMLSDLRDLFS